MLLLPLFPLVFLIASSQFVPFKVDHDGNLLPRASLRSVLDQQIEWYLKCGNASKTGGYATWISNAFMTGDCVPDGFAVLPGIGPSQALQAMVLYLSLPDSSNSSVSRRDVLDLANSLASYLVKETLTPNEGAWPGVPRSTGISAFPITVSAQADALYGPDTIGIEEKKSVLVSFVTNRAGQGCNGWSGSRSICKSHKQFTFPQRLAAHCFSACKEHSLGSGSVSCTVFIPSEFQDWSFVQRQGDRFLFSEKT
jgi:hypothetical protein